MLPLALIYVHRLPNVQPDPEILGVTSVSEWVNNNPLDNPELYSSIDDNQPVLPSRSSSLLRSRELSSLQRGNNHSHIEENTPLPQITEVEVNDAPRDGIYEIPSDVLRNSSGGAVTRFV